MYYPEDLWEAPETALGLRTDVALATTVPGQLSTTRASLPPPKIFEGLGKVGDQGQGVEVAKGKEACQDRAWPEDKGKGKKAKTLP